MKASTIQWHLSRDTCEALARFCNDNRQSQTASDIYEVDGVEGRYFTITYQFNNGGFIKAELRAGDERGYTVADHFQVTDYDLGYLTAENYRLLKNVPY